MEVTTELNFLVRLLLDDRVPKTVRKDIAERIKEVEAAISALQSTPRAPGAIRTSSGGPINSRANSATQDANPVPPEQVAQTMATQQAMAAREQAIAQAMSGTKGDSVFKKHVS